MNNNSRAMEKEEKPDVIVGVDLDRFPVARPPKGREMMEARCMILGAFSEDQPPEEVEAVGYLWRHEPGSYWVTKPGQHAFVCARQVDAEVSAEVRGAA